MNRPIKFRAWDKEHHIMSYSPENKINFAGQIHLHSGWADVEDTCYVLMQYIGIKDLNGQEVYEGDIVTTTGDNETPAIGRVVYSGIGFAFRGTKEPRFEGDTEEWFDTVTAEISVISTLEVIGNIYENPELLEES